MKNVIGIFVFAIFCTPLSISAQAYGTAVGVRVGNGIGLSVKQQIASKSTLEVIGQRNFATDMNTISVLGMRHFNALFIRNFNVYGGGGGYVQYPKSSEVNSPKVYGISPILGTEVTFLGLNFSLDYKPMLNLSGTGSALENEVAASVRIRLKGRN